MKKQLLRGLVVFTSLLMTFTAKSQAFTENFDDITTLTGVGGWFIQNNSTSVGPFSWSQGNPAVFGAYNGAANSFISVNYQSTGTPNSTISNWLCTPNRTFRNGDVFTFYTRCAPENLYPDRLQVRLSTNGASTNVGTGPTAVGDFTTLLLEINPTQVTDVYPYAGWQLYTITISGLPAPTSGRIAFRYFVTSAGPSAPNSDYIGIDNVVYTPYVCPAFTMTSGGALTGGTAGSAYSTTLTQTGALGTPGFAVTAGALPPGMTLAANGTISGTPTATGTFNFTVTAYDASGCSGSQAYSITIVCPANPTSIATFPELCSNGMSYTLVEGSPAGGSYSGTGVSGGQFDPASGTQTITYDYTDPYGCPHYTNATLTVNTPPTVDAGADQTVCDGDQVTLSGTGADTYVWDNGVIDGVAFQPSVGAVIYTVIGTDANGCENTATVDVMVNGLPTVGAGADQTVCDGDQVTLNGSGADTYTWDNSVTDGVAFQPAVGTETYTVTGTDANGCENTATVDVTVNALPIVDAGADQTVCDGDQVTLNGSGADIYIWDNSVIDGVTFQPAVGTETYTVTGTDANGCENTATVDVTVNALPTVDAGADQTVCEGTQVTLNGSGADSYSWDNSVTDGVAFTATTTETYTVTGTDVNGCENTATVEVTVNENPTVSLDPFTSPCINHAPVALSGGTPVGGIYSGPGVSNGEFDPAAAGVGIHTITYTYEDGNSCEGSATASIEVDACVGIEAGNVEALSIFPNPASSELNVVFENVSGADATVVLTTTDGKIVYQASAKAMSLFNEKINVTDFANGVYFINIKSETASLVQRVVLN